MIRLITAIIALLAFAGQLTAETLTGRQIVDRVAEKITKSKAVTVNYTVTSPDGNSDGTITIKGDRFYLKSAPMTIWYDGRTQWTYSPSAGEVNITEPTPEELAQINPLVIIGTLRNTCEVRTLTAPKGSLRVELTPRDKKSADITKAVITVNQSTMLPRDISLDMRSGTALKLTVNSADTTTDYPITTFTFTKAKCPQAEVIDLR